MGLLLASTAVVAVCAEFLVSSIDEMVKTSGVSQAFIGLIVLPIVGNAAEVRIPFPCVFCHFLLKCSSSRYYPSGFGVLKLVGFVGRSDLVRVLGGDDVHWWVKCRWWCSSSRHIFFVSVVVCHCGVA